MNFYKTSDGQRISKAEIDRKVRKAKEELLRNQLNENGFNFCEDCANSGVPNNIDDMELRTLDCAHLLSVDQCQKAGKSEFAWSLKNMMVMCRRHHKEYDKLNLKFKKS